MVRSTYFRKIGCFLSALVCIAPVYAIEPQPVAKTHDSYEGLTSWNRVARTIDKYIVKPCIKHPMASAIGVMLFSTLAPWAYNNQIRELTLKQAISSLSEYIGTHPMEGHYLPCLLALSVFNMSELDVPPTWLKKVFGVSTREQQEQLMRFEYKLVKPFEKLWGLDSIKAQCAPALEYAKDPVLYAQTHENLTTNYVFFGAPRTTAWTWFSYTFMYEMEAVNPSMLRFYISTQELNKLDVSDIEGLFKAMQLCAPCVVFIDNTLEEMNGNFELNWNFRTALAGRATLSPSPDRPVFLILTTNKLEAIDSSMTSRPQAMHAQWILFKYPSRDERIQFLRQGLHDLTSFASIDPNRFDIELLAEKTEGYPFEHLNSCIIRAWFYSCMSRTVLTTESIIEVINEKNLNEKNLIRQRNTPVEPQE